MATIYPDQEIYINNPMAILNYSSTNIEGAITPSKVFNIDMLRRFSWDNIATTNPVIETATVGTDSSGAFTTNWKPETSNIKLIGGRYAYYPKIYDGITTYYGQGIAVFDKDEMLVNQLEYALGDIQNIPVYDELSKDTMTDGTSMFNFTYKNWREDFPILVLKDGIIVSPSNVLHNEGKVLLSTTTDGTNEINASYTFRFFSSQQLNSFIDRTVSEINMQSPVTEYGKDTFPDYWVDTIVTGAAVRALDALFVSIIFREKQVIFADPAVVSNISQYYSRISAAYDMAKTKVKKIHDTSPLAVTGYDTMAPPRVMGSAFRDYIFLKGKAF